MCGVFLITSKISSETSVHSEFQVICNALLHIIERQISVFNISFNFRFFCLSFFSFPLRTSGHLLGSIFGKEDGKSHFQKRD